MTMYKPVFLLTSPVNSISDFFTLTEVWALYNLTLFNEGSMSSNSSLADLILPTGLIITSFGPGCFQISLKSTP